MVENGHQMLLKSKAGVMQTLQTRVKGLSLKGGDGSYKIRGSAIWFIGTSTWAFTISKYHKSAFLPRKKTPYCHSIMISNIYLTNIDNHKNKKINICFRLLVVQYNNFNNLCL